MDIFTKISFQTFFSMLPGIGDHVLGLVDHGGEGLGRTWFPRTTSSLLTNHPFKYSLVVTHWRIHPEIERSKPRQCLDLLSIRLPTPTY